MLLQRGRFIVKNKEELECVIPEKNGLKKVIDLDYMGRYEYEGNTIPILRMLIEYSREDYSYCPLDIYNNKGEQMYIYIRTSNELSKDNLMKIAINEIKMNYTLYEYINNPNKKLANDFWWNIEYNYMIFFGIEKIKLIEYFINSCYERDGGKQIIGKTLSRLKL